MSPAHPDSRLAAVRHELAEHRAYLAAPAPPEDWRDGLEPGEADRIEREEHEYRDACRVWIADLEAEERALVTAVLPVMAHTASDFVPVRVAS